MNPPVSFFASYSRRDKNYVKPVVDLLRSGAAHVFVDQESIRPGDRWEMVLESNLENAATLLIPGAVGEVGVDGPGKRCAIRSNQSDWGREFIVMRTTFEVEALDYDSCRLSI